MLKQKKKANVPEWNKKMDFTSPFDKRLHSLELGRHHQRLLTSVSTINTSTPRNYLEFKKMHENVIRHQLKEQKIAYIRRKKLSGIYKKKSSKKNKINNHETFQNKILLKSQSSYISLDDDIAICTHNQSLDINKNMNDNSASASNVEWIKKRKRYMSEMAAAQVKAMNTRRRHVRIAKEHEQRRINTENKILNDRLQLVQVSDCLSISSMAKHWERHSNLKRHINIRKKRIQDVPDIILTAKKSLNQHKSCERLSKPRLRAEFADMMTSHKLKQYQTKLKTNANHRPSTSPSYNALHSICTAIQNTQIHRKSKTFKKRRRRKNIGNIQRKSRYRNKCNGKSRHSKYRSGKENISHRKILSNASQILKTPAELLSKQSTKRIICSSNSSENYTSIHTHRSNCNIAKRNHRKLPKI